MNTRDDVRIVARGGVDSPLGRLTLAATDDGLVSAVFPRWRTDGAAVDEGKHGAEDRCGANAVIDLAVRALDEYFAGEGVVTTIPPLDLAGTELQRAVWATLLKIPPGAMWTYGAVAHAIGRPTAARAVAAAIGANPVGVLVPCHRVIGSDGSLTGYAGGLERKRWLLAHEGAALAF